MISNWQWRLLQLTRRVWFRSSMFSVAGVATALMALILTPYIPDETPAKIGADAVDGILTIIASSMLAVTTFSLSTMVAAYGAATTNVTPRATRLLVEDPTSQNVLATFIGAFLFSLVGIIALSTGLYGEKGRLVLFVVTLVIIVVIVATLVRWIDYLSHFGRVEATTRQVEETASKAMKARHKRPTLGGLPFAAGAAAPSGASPVFASEIGYVQHVDIEALQKCGEMIGGHVYLAVLPGAFVDRRRPVAWISGGFEKDTQSRLQTAISIGDVRSFDQDPRFGLTVLSEIASRALSPAINDPGTAIDVIGRAVRILSIWTEPTERPDCEYARVSVPEIAVDDLFDDAFTSIARDGARMVEVQIRLQKALSALARTGDPRFAAAAERHSEAAFARARTALTEKTDLDALTSSMANSR